MKIRTSNAIVGFLKKTWNYDFFLAHLVVLFVCLYPDQYGCHVNLEQSAATVCSFVTREAVSFSAGARAAVLSPCISCLAVPTRSNGRSQTFVALWR